MSKRKNHVPSHALSRRRFVSTLGTCALGLPVASAFLRARVSAQSAGTPVRFLAVKSFHGTYRNYWIPRTAGGAEPPQADMALSDLTFDYARAILKPLQPWRNKITILDGLDHSVVLDYAPGYGGHERGPTALTATGVPEGANAPLGESVDRLLARRLGTAAGKPLVVGVGTVAADTRSFSFDSKGAAISAQEDPNQVFNTLFSGVASGGDPNAAKRFALRKSILDRSIGEVSTLRGELTGDERLKLDAHLTGLQNLQASLKAPISCSAPTPPGSGADQGYQNVQATVGKFANLLAQAFACDLSRVATLQIQRDYQDEPMQVPEAQPFVQAAHRAAGYHNGVVHTIWSTPGTDPAHDVYAAGQRWHSTMFASLLQALDVPDPLGTGTILDNTVIYWTNELGGMGGHAEDYFAMPIVIAGGGGGKIRAGRYLRLRDMNTRNFVPHNRGLVSICHALGFTDINFFGDSRAANKANYQGPLTQLMK